MRLRKAAVPDSVIQLELEFEQFRSTRTGRAKLPDSLWQAAVEQARQHGANVVAHTLRLDYNALKKRMGAVAEPYRDQSPTSFVELIGGAAQEPANMSSSSRLLPVRGCGCSGRVRRRWTGRRCCERGAKWRDDPDHAADAGAGGDRAGGWTQGDRLTGAAVSGTTGGRSFFRLRVHLQKPAWHDGARAEL